MRTHGVAGGLGGMADQRGGRTIPRTTKERRTERALHITYTINIVSSNLPKKHIEILNLRRRRLDSSANGGCFCGARAGVWGKSGGVVMPGSAVRVREVKFGKKFDLVDMDHDGITTVGDWEEFGCYLCSQFGESIDSPTGTQVREAVLGWWYQALGRVYGEGDDRQLTREEFTAYYSAGAEEEFGGVVHQYIDAVFGLCDGDADGRLARREFAGVLRVHGVPECELSQIMRRMVGDDGGISREKYAGLMLDFCFSDETQSPGSWFLGKL